MGWCRELFLTVTVCACCSPARWVLVLLFFFPRKMPFSRGCVWLLLPRAGNWFMAQLGIGLSWCFSSKRVTWDMAEGFFCPQETKPKALMFWWCFGFFFNSEVISFKEGVQTPQKAANCQHSPLVPLADGLRKTLLSPFWALPTKWAPQELWAKSGPMDEENSCRKSTEFGKLKLPRRVTSKKRADGRRALDVPGNRKSKSAAGKWSKTSNFMLVFYFALGKGLCFPSFGRQSKDYFLL